MSRILSLLLALLVAAPAAAKHWETPALGPSASGGPEILFTFDDGPDNKLTPQLLETLADHGVRAVFFVLGQGLDGKARSKKRVALVNRMLAAGHVIGNHTYDHKDLCLGKDDARATKEIDGGARVINEVTGIPPVLLRTPFGTRCDRVDDALATRNVLHVFWDFDSQEWKTKDAGATRDYMIGRIGKLKGRAVILLHDIQPATIGAVPEILRWIDEENARRRTAGQPPIRILEPADIGDEHSGRTARAGKAALDAAATTVPAVVDRLLGPLAPL
jgi:peptidoglycan/xylan/chitin deacetylase (PgdA/CDA1 family)